MNEPVVFDECPRCHMPWSEEEITLQQCGGCGYPKYESDYDPFDEFVDPDDE